MTKILLVEDDKKLARFLQLELEHEGYEVLVAHDGCNGLELAVSGNFQLIVLDIMLPCISGIELCRRIRKKSDIPIIMLTAKDDIADKVTGLDSGADDYVTKPFAIEEIFARIRSMERRRERSSNRLTNKLQNGRLEVNKDNHMVTYLDNPINLTGKEYSLLIFMLENTGLVLSRDEILETVWGYDFIGETNIVDVYISYLRSKIDQCFDIELIKTIRGFGYMIDKKDRDEKQKI